MTGAVQVTDRAFTDLDSEHVAHHLAGAGKWQQLLLDQIHHSRSNIGSILDGSMDPGWKCSTGDMLTVGTLFLLCPIFPYQQTRRRQIHDLATLSSTCCNRLQAVLAGFTPFYLLLDDLIWRRGELQARSLMPWLPSRFLLALFAQAFGLSYKTIRGRRQVAIVTVFRDLVPQAFHLLAQTTDLLSHLLDQRILLRDHLLLLFADFSTLYQLLSQDLILFSQMLQFFFNRHALTLLGLMPLGKSPADLGSYEPSSCIKQTTPRDRRTRPQHPTTSPIRKRRLCSV